jgi:hypothetical protein
MKKYVFLTLIVCFIVISYIAQEEKEKEEQYECWDGQEHWYAPIFHVHEMFQPGFWEEWKEACEQYERQQQELNGRDQ